MSLKYRLPKYSELMPIFHNCKKQLETGEEIGGLDSYSIGNEYGWAISISTLGDYFALNGNQYKFDNWFCAVRGSRVLYGIMNRQPAPARGNTTGNYKYAVKMTFEDPKEDKGIARIQVYYLGPNYNLSLNTAGYYCCHESFWNKLDTKDIIDRRVRVGGDYWLNYDETHQLTKNVLNIIKLHSMLLYKMHMIVFSPWWKDGLFIPWLKEPAW